MLLFLLRSTGYILPSICESLLPLAYFLSVCLSIFLDSDSHYNSRKGNHRNFVLVLKCLYFQNKVLIRFLAFYLLNFGFKNEENRIEIWKAITVLINKLKFGTHVCFNKFHVCIKFQLSGSNPFFDIKICVKLKTWKSFNFSIQFHN